MPVRKVCKTRLSQSLLLETGNPLQVAEEERIRWALGLAQYFKEAGLPVVKIMEDSEDLTKRGGSLRDKGRAKTLFLGYGLEEVLHLAPIDEMPILAGEVG